MRARALIAAAAHAAVIWAIALLPAAACADEPGAVTEPLGLWTGPMYGRTPDTLAGAQVVDLVALDALMADRPLLIDVGPAIHKPDSLPAGRPWMPTHRSIPGAVWMPGAGAAPLDAGREALFYRRMEELTQGDRTRAIVVFCRRQCWGSWNAGKRLVTKGYTSVRWFPQGMDGWQDMHETAEVMPDAIWSAEPAR